ncbi:OmpA family protein [Sphingomonas sp. HDW15A]|uniref:OmpA family protein n=1 Tax=Sphingomonas sp. HDW15A TaxID=2714942 RepID=UPI00140AA35C|nr:OmpA family protein [Sphingomonas sp. HDW15A]QIK95749.1 OmpA family protein [Sphingomonas sp. HDW15A]
MRHGASLAAAFLLSGCATSSVTLLADDGSPTSGALAVIEQDGSETVLNQPMTAGKLTKGETKVRPVKELKPAYQQLVGGLPPAPAHFTLNFVQGTTEVTAASRPVLDLIRKEVANRPGAAIEVVGHTDTVGSEADNDRLSQERASEVVKVLVGEGFSEDLLLAVGRGERDLKVKTADNVANEENRRVEVVVR